MSGWISINVIRVHTIVPVMLPALTQKVALSVMRAAKKVLLLTIRVNVEISRNVGTKV